MPTEDENRAAIESALYAEIARRQVEADDEDTAGSPMVLAWALSYEYVTEGMDAADTTAGGVVVMSDSQSRSTSRGVLELGVDRFKV